MLSTLLPLLESLGSDGGASTSLGRHSGLGSTLGRLLGGSQVQAFGDQNELGGAMRQISDLTSSIAAAKESLSQMRTAHAEHEVQQQESERLYGFRDPQRSDEMANLQRQQIEHARQMQLQQQQMENLQARAAVTMDPQLAAQDQRQSAFRRAGSLAVGGQLVQSLGPSFLRNLPGVQAASNLGGFAAGSTNAHIIGGMANTATNAVSNVAGGAMQGASMGSFAGPAGMAVGAAIGGMASAAGEIAKLPSRIQDWSEELLASQKTISRFSGEMSLAFAQREVRGLKRDMASAAVTGGSTADLTRSMEDLYDTLRPLKDTVTIVLSRELTALVKVLNTMSPVLAALAGSTAVFADAMTGNAFNFTAQLAKAVGEVVAQEVATARNRERLGAGASAAISRLLAEDKSKPRQAPRR